MAHWSEKCSDLFNHPALPLGAAWECSLRPSLSWNRIASLVQLNSSMQGLATVHAEASKMKEQEEIRGTGYAAITPTTGKCRGLYSR